MNLVWHPPTPGIALPCPICDAPGPHPVLVQAGLHTLLRCQGCTVCFFRERIRPDYENEQGAALFEQLSLEQTAGLHRMIRFLYTIDDDAMDSLLDVGCGFGFPVDCAAKVLGWRAVGIDPSHHARAGAALLHADIRKEYLTAQTDLGQPYSLVLASEVIEHIPDPYPFMQVLRRWLKPGGTLVLTTPDADALTPATNPAAVLAMLSVGAHLILFSARSMELYLRRAGFRHVHVTSSQDTLMVHASDRKLRFRDDADARHRSGYQAYLRQLVDTAAPGTPLWNGAAGRLFALDADREPLEPLFALWHRIVTAWRDRFGIDVQRLRLPPILPELAHQAPGGTSLAQMAGAQPFNLGIVLCNRAVLESRVPGRTPEQVIAFARAAYAHAVQTRRVMQSEAMIDLELKAAAWRARLMMLDSLVELAPELEVDLLMGLAQPSPGSLHDRIDPPPDVVINRIAGPFAHLVHANQYDAAERLEPWMRDLDAVCAATAADPMRMYHALFTIGVLRMNHLGQPAAARAAFQRIGDEAQRRLADPAGAELAAHFLAVAADHVRMAEARLPPQPEPLPEPQPQPEPQPEPQTAPAVRRRRKALARAAGV